MDKLTADEMLKADAIATAIDEIKTGIKLKRMLAVSVAINVALVCILLANF